MIGRTVEAMINTFQRHELVSPSAHTFARGPAAYWMDKPGEWAPKEANKHSSLFCCLIHIGVYRGILGGYCGYMGRIGYIGIYGESWKN